MKERSAFRVRNVNELKEKLKFYITTGINSEEYLDELGKQWVKKADVNWGTLYNENKPKKISLPVYPFAKEHCWIPKSTEFLNNQPKKLHPLIDINISTLEEQKFKIKFNGNEYLFSDHIVSGQKMLPGTAYIEMAYCTGILSTGKVISAIKDIIWEKPIEIANKERELYISLYPEKEGIEYEIWDEANNGERNIYGTGCLVFESKKEEPSRLLDISTIKHRCKKTRSNNECYNIFESIGLKYGECFKSIQEVYIGENEVLAKIGLPKKCEETYEQYFLHPVIMDGSLQGIVGFIDSDETNLRIPFSIKKINLLNKLTKSCYAYIKQKDIQSFDILILDDTGKLLVEIINFQVRDLQKKGDSSVIYLTPVWKQKNFIQLTQTAKSIIIFDTSDNLSNSLSEISECKLIKIDAKDNELPIYSVFTVVKELMNQRLRNKIRIIYVCRCENPIDLAMSGFFKTLQIENPNFICKTVSSNNTPEILNEINCEGEEILYKDSIRYEREFEEISLSEHKTLNIKKGGTYIITGGMGGLGLIFAKYFANKANVRLVLTGRSDLTPEKQNKIDEIISLGSEVLYIKADISNYDHVQELIKTVRKKFKDIDGVIHSAGIIRDAFIIKKTKSQIEEVIKPKIYGTKYLYDSLKKSQHDFFVCFSSISSVFGNIGQCDYAYANSFMDNFAMQNKGITSINWPLWKSGGMKVDQEVEKMLEKTFGTKSLAINEGIKAFERTVASKVAQVTVLVGNKTKLSSTINIKKFIEEADDNNDDQMKDLHKKVENDLILICSELLKIKQTDIDINDTFDEYGVDSIMMIKMLNKIEEIYGKPLEATSIAEYNTTKALAAYIVENGISKSNTSEEPKIPNKANPIVIENNNINNNFYRFNKSRIHQNLYSKDTQKIAIISISCKFPGANNPEEFWNNLAIGKNLITEIPKDRWDIQEYFSTDKKARNKSYSKWGGFIDNPYLFDAKFFGISDEDAIIMDPQQRILLELTEDLLQIAGYDKDSIKNTRTSVFIGGAESDYAKRNIESIPENLMKHMIINTIQNMMAARISDFYNLNGVSETIDTACSSSLVAIHHACQSIRNGECEMAITGGVELLLSPYNHIRFSKAEVYLRIVPVAYLMKKQTELFWRRCRTHSAKRL